MRRHGSAALAALGASVMLAACAVTPGGAEQSDEPPEHLTVLVTASPSADALRLLAAEYEAESGIAIEFVEVPYTQLATKMILAAQSHQHTFDVAMVDGFQMPLIVTGDALAPLDSYLGSDDYYDAGDFPPGLQNYAKQDGVSYGIPLSTEPYLQWYRTDLYDDLDLEPAITWDEALANARAVQDSGGHGYMAVYDAAGAAHFYNAMLVSAGGRLLDPDTNRPLLDTAAARTAMERYLGLADYGPPGVSSASVFDAVNSFGQLDVGAMTLASGWWTTVNDPAASPAAGLVATAETPMSADGPYPPVSVLYGWLAGISSVSPYRDAAWDFLSWSLGPDNAQALVDTGAPPGRISTVTNPEFISQLPYLPAVGQASEDGLPMARMPEMSRIVTTMSQTISSMASHQMTIDEGMATMQDDVTDILVQAGRYEP